MFDELGHAGLEHLDPVYVAGYDAKAHFDPADDLALLSQHGLDETSTLVDFGCGTGALALAAAPLFRRVVAVDVSPAMVDALRARIERLPIHNVEVVEDGFLTYEHRGDPPGVVYSRNALHHLPDLWKALALERVATMLRPGGTLLLHDIVLACEPAEAPDVIDAWLANAPADHRDGWTRPELETHLREEHSTFSWLLEPMLEHAGFVIQEAVYRDSRTYARYLCRRGGTPGSPASPLLADGSALEARAELA